MGKLIEIILVLVEGKMFFRFKIKIIKTICYTYIYQIFLNSKLFLKIF